MKERSLHSGSGVWSHLKAEGCRLPNLITALRVVLTCAGFWAYREGPALLSAVVFAAALSDALDGYLARKLGLESSFGRTFDSLADYFLAGSMLWWLWIGCPKAIHGHGATWLVIVLAVAIPQALALVRLGRFAGFHLYSAKLTGLTGCVAFLWAINRGFQPALLQVFMALVVAKGLEESAVCLLVDDPFDDPRPSLLAYLRDGKAT